MGLLRKAKEVFISSSAEAHPAVPRLKSGGRDALTLRGLLHHPFLLPSCAFPSLKTVLALQSLVFSAEREALILDLGFLIFPFGVEDNRAGNRQEWRSMMLLDAL